MAVSTELNARQPIPSGAVGADRGQRKCAQLNFE
jgi:hypothetical protein